MLLLINCNDTLLKYLKTLFEDMLTECFMVESDDDIDASQVPSLLLVECLLQTRTYKQWSSALCC
jgi:hypothetical protein